jgi:pimeloyl-ACP methyl ester carboxylesterase
MNTMKAGILNVSGANLHYEVRGSGPVLLAIPGGPADGEVFGAMAGILAGRYSVVTFDPRGLSRSRLDGPPEQPIVEVLADDAHRLLAAAGAEPAYVFGSSGGGLVGLELVLRHPEQVRAIVVHEPPAAALMPDSAGFRESIQAVYDTYTMDGVWPGMHRFLAVSSQEPPKASGPQGEPTPEMLEAMARFQANAEFFLAHYLLGVTDYAPDIAALKAASTRIVVGVGDASQGQVAHQSGLDLAGRLGTQAVVFPGDHGGFLAQPAEFAEALDAVLRHS